MQADISVRVLRGHVDYTMETLLHTKRVLEGTTEVLIARESEGHVQLMYHEVHVEASLVVHRSKTLVVRVVDPAVFIQRTVNV